jgi:hypothetical protein
VTILENHLHFQTFHIPTVTQTKPLPIPKHRTINFSYTILDNLCTIPNENRGHGSVIKTDRELFPYDGATVAVLNMAGVSLFLRMGAAWYILNWNFHGAARLCKSLLDRWSGLSWERVLAVALMSKAPSKIYYSPAVVARCHIEIGRLTIVSRIEILMLIKVNVYLQTVSLSANNVLSRRWQCWGESLICWFELS